jgi:hypothetical protein
MPIRGRFIWSCVTDFTTDLTQEASIGRGATL